MYFPASDTCVRGQILYFSVSDTCVRGQIFQFPAPDARVRRHTFQFPALDARGNMDPVFDLPPDARDQLTREIHERGGWLSDRFDASIFLARASGFCDLYGDSIAITFALVMARRYDLISAGAN